LVNKAIAKIKKCSVSGTQCGFHIWQLSRSNGGVAPTITSDDLDLPLWHWHILTEKFSKLRPWSRFLSGHLRFTRSHLSL